MAGIETPEGSVVGDEAETFGRVAPDHLDDFGEGKVLEPGEELLLLRFGEGGERTGIGIESGHRFG